MKIRTVSTVVCASAGALLLAACGEAEEPAEVAAANDDCVAGIEVADAWMASPAIAGDPAAVYFTITNTGERDRMIRAADVEGAQSAMLHATGEWNLQPSMDEMSQVNVPAGEATEFNPDTYHVMAMNTDPTLEVGGTSEVTLTVLGGDKCSFPATVRGPGDMPDSGDAAG